MIRISKYFTFIFILIGGYLVLAGCAQKVRYEDETPMPDTLSVDTIVEVDSLPPVEEVQVFESDSLSDEFFEDFIFAFSQDSVFRRRRLRSTLTYISATGDTSRIPSREWIDNFDFLDQDFYTVFYDSISQIELFKTDIRDTVMVERIDLDSLRLTAYHFERSKRGWRLFQANHMYVRRSPLSDFLVFYRQFSRDSIFQQSCIAQPLTFSMIDPEDDMEVIEGTIDASQWFSFCPEVPAGTISNIVYGQTYQSPHRIVMQKCGQGSGFMEIFTFEKNAGHWKLISYEN